MYHWLYEFIFGSKEIALTDAHAAISEELLLIIAANIPLNADTYRVKIHLNALNRRFRQNSWLPPNDLQLRNFKWIHRILPDGTLQNIDCLYDVRLIARNRNIIDEVLFQFLLKHCPFIRVVVLKDGYTILGRNHPSQFVSFKNYASFLDSKVDSGQISIDSNV